MQPRRIVHSFLRVGLAGALLLASGGSLLAQDDIVPTVDSAETAAMPVPAEFSEESAAEAPEIDPDATTDADVIAEEQGDATTGVPEIATDEAELAGVDIPELGADSAQGGPEANADSEGDFPAAGEIRLFLPSVMTDGSLAAADASAAEPLDAALALDAAAAEGASQVASSQSVMGDFNGDGFSDLAVGVPYEDLISGGVNRVNAGAVNVIYGAAGGLNAANNQVWTQDSPGIAGVVGAGDLFGWALAAGDFNNDGRDDLAISAPYEDFSGIVDAGAVNVLYGTAAGLAAGGNQIWTQNTAGVLDVANAGDLFGLSLTAADFNRNGRDDLAIGVPYEDVGAAANAGLVQVLYGSVTGLNAAGNQAWMQGIGGILGGIAPNDLFGRTLASGDFDANGNPDLAVGVPYEDLGAIANAGVVHIIRSNAAGLTAVANQVFSENTAGILGVAEANDYYGWALAAGNFNGAGAADLAIGVPYEDFGALTNAGTVNVIYGVGGAGLVAGGNQVWSQNSAGILGVAGSGDTFGYSLSAGRFNPGAFGDLAIGVPLEDLPGQANAGAVNVIYGAGGGLGGGNQFWSQDSAGILAVANANDQFGLSLAVGDFNGNTVHDLVIGVPYEDLGAVNQGAANVIYGVAGGLNPAGNQFWSQDSPGILGVGEPNDYFGYVNQ